ncbi:sugar-phosphatase [Clostridium sp. KNHs214]|uniref:sugar-phosphatase n=1 Tax=Clostridium sp. KNHs214 TaxID=1540257 RepID=UPI000550D1BB|nr:sugar-phosphatase [Clostridium sp. KNHs214]
MFKLLAIDLDGTLLKNDKTISKVTYEAIQRARKKGVKVVLATGRPIKGISRYIEKLDLLDEDDCSVAFNGAAVQFNKTGKLIYEQNMEIEDIKYLYKLSKGLGVNIHALTPNECITPKISEYSLLEAEINKIPLKVVDFDNLDPDTNIVKIMMIDKEEILSKTVEQLPEEVYEKYSVLRSEPYFLEFLNKEVNKEQGVKKLAEGFGIKKEEVICIGDAGNDIHMIQYAGLGVAMENAMVEVKRIADYITLTNEEDGVAHIIEKFILNKIEIPEFLK